MICASFLVKVYQDFDKFWIDVSGKRSSHFELDFLVSKKTVSLRWAFTNIFDHLRKFVMSRVMTEFTYVFESR